MLSLSYRNIKKESLIVFWEGQGTNVCWPWSGATKMQMMEMTSWSNLSVPVHPNPLTLWNCLYKPWAQPLQGAGHSSSLLAPLYTKLSLTNSTSLLSLGFSIHFYNTETQEPGLWDSSNSLGLRLANKFAWPVWDLCNRGDTHQLHRKMGQESEAAAIPATETTCSTWGLCYSLVGTVSRLKFQSQGGHCNTRRITFLWIPVSQLQSYC